MISLYLDFGDHLNVTKLIPVTMPLAINEPRINTFALDSTISALGGLVLDEPNDNVYLAILLTASGFDFRCYSYPVGILPCDVSWDEIFEASDASQDKTEMPELVLLAVKAFGSILRFNFKESHQRIVSLERQALGALEDNARYLRLAQNLWYFRYCLTVILATSIKDKDPDRHTAKALFKDMRHWDNWTFLFWPEGDNPNIDEEAGAHFLYSIGKLVKQLKPGKFAFPLAELHLPSPHMNVMEAKNREARNSSITLDESVWLDL